MCPRPPSDGGRRPGPGSPRAAGTILPAAPWPVEPRPYRGQDDGQQGGRDRDADQRDQHAGDAESAENRNGRARSARRAIATVVPLTTTDARVRHRVPNGGLVAAYPPLMLLAPAHHDQERIVDCDPESGQRDEELHGDRDLGDLGERPDEQERGRDGDQCHRAEHDRHERREDEGQDDERAGARHQDLHEDADAGAGVLALVRGAKRLEAGYPDRRPANGGPVERRLRAGPPSGRARAHPAEGCRRARRRCDRPRRRMHDPRSRRTASRAPGSRTSTLAEGGVELLGDAAESTVVPSGSVTTGRIGATSPPFP